MDNFRNPKSHQRKSSAVDGFMSQGPSRRPAQAARPNALQSTARGQNRVDNFRGPDGFRPNTQPRLNASAPKPGKPMPQKKMPNMAKMDVSLPPAGKVKKHRSRKKIIFRSAGVLFLLVVITGGYLFGKGYFKLNDVFQGGGSAPALAKNVDPSTLKGEGDGRVNILMLGKGGDGHEAPDLTDTLLIASIDPVNKKAALLSVPRDLWVTTDNGTSKINAVYANAKYAVLAEKKTADTEKRAEAAGIQAIKSTVEKSMGIPMHYYLMVDFEAFVQAINTVGGLDINIDPNDASGTVRETLWDEMTGKNYVLDVKPGLNHFDGQRALMYSRSRHTSARGDFDRTERQRKVLIALKDKILSAGTYGNPVKISQLLSDFGDHISSDLSTADLLRVYDIAKTIDSSQIVSVGLADPPNILVTTGDVNGQSIVRPKAGLSDFSEIQNFVRNSLKDGYIQNENASIAVYNGSGISGLAAKKADELKSYGYNITTVANAPNTNYPKTVLVDLTAGKKKYTMHYLEQRLGVTAVTSMPDASISAGSADFVIILGKNESNNP